MSQTYIPVELRRLIRERAGNRCEYCLIPEAVTFASHEVDHIIAEKHGGETNADNLAESCTLCNRYKGTDLATVDRESGDIVPLFHPRRDSWRVHFHFVDNRIEGKTPTGTATARLLQLNQPARVAERKLLLATGMLLVPSE